MNRWAGNAALVLLVMVAAGIADSVTLDARGQASGRLTGVVRDAQGLPVPGAAVTATAQGGGAGRDAVTDQAGRYDLQGLPSGTYTVRVQLAGFAPAVREQVAVTATTPDLDFGLQVDALLEQVTVTARRREESLQDTPIAVSAFTEAQLVNLSVSDVRDVAFFTPNLTQSMGPAGGNDGQFFIRGIGQGDFSAATDPGVATYIDGVYLGRTTGASFDLFDIERVEVLRGPQGTLFGRNAVGGAINVVTPLPGDRFEFNGELTAGAYQRFGGKFGLNIPISPTLGARVSFIARHENGYMRRIDGTTLGDEEIVSGRVKLAWTPNPRAVVVFSADGVRRRGTAVGQINLGAVPGRIAGFNPATQQPILVGHSPLFVPIPADINADQSTDRYLSFSSQEPIHDLDVWGTALDATFTVGRVAVRSITAFRGLDQLFTADFDATQYVFYDQRAPTSQKQISEEVQVSDAPFGGRLRWVLGAFVFNEKVDQTNAIGMGGAPRRLAFESIVVNNQSISLDVNSMAGFGEITAAVTPRVNVTAGLRYTTEEKEQGYNFIIDNRSGTALFVTDPLGLVLPRGVSIPFSPLALPFAPPFWIRDQSRIGRFPAFPPTTVRGEWSKWTSRAGAEVRVGGDALVYGSYARGFKSGGFNGRPVGAGDVKPYNPEYVDTIEAGVKSEYLSNRLRLNVAGFFSNYHDIQVLVASPNLGEFFSVQNAARAEIRGIEVEASARPTRDFAVDVGIGSMRGEIKEVYPGIAGPRLGQRIGQAPTWDIFAGAQYGIGLGGAGRVTPRVDLTHQSEVFLAAASESVRGAFSLLNLRFTWEPAVRAGRTPYRVSVYGLNVTDEYYLGLQQDVRSSFGTWFGYPQAPARWGVEFGFNFQ